MDGLRCLSASSRNIALQKVFRCSQAYCTGSLKAGETARASLVRVALLDGSPAIANLRKRAYGNGCREDRWLDVKDSEGSGRANDSYTTAVRTFNDDILKQAQVTSITKSRAVHHNKNQKTSLIEDGERALLNCINAKRSQCVRPPTEAKEKPLGVPRKPLLKQFCCCVWVTRRSRRNPLNHVVTHQATNRSTKETAESTRSYRRLVAC